MCVQGQRQPCWALSIVETPRQQVGEASESTHILHSWTLIFFPLIESIGKIWTFGATKFI